MRIQSRRRTRSLELAAGKSIDRRGPRLTPAETRTPAASLWDLIGSLERRLRYRRDLRRLLELSPHLLNDIGLNVDDVRSECGKPFWRS